MKKIFAIIIMGITLLTLSGCAQIQQSMINALAGAETTTPEAEASAISDPQTVSPSMEALITPTPTQTARPIPTMDATPEQAFERAMEVENYQNVESPSEAISALLLLGDVLPDARVEEFLAFHAALCEMLLSDPALLEQVSALTPERQAANFYAVTTSEDGAVSVTTDIAALYDALKDHLSEEALKYFQLELKYADYTLVAAGALTESWDYLAGYMLDYYDYLYTDNALFRRVPTLRKYSQAYDIYTGATQLKNTPSVKDDALIPEVKASYESFLKEHAASPLAEDIQKLENSWKTSDYKLNDEVKEMIDTQSTLVEQEVNKNLTGK